MGSLTHTSGAHKRFTQTQGCEKFKREFLHIRWVNNKCRNFLDSLNVIENDFCNDKVKELTNIFKNFLNIKVKAKFYNFDKINFKLSSINNIFHLKKSFYYHMAYDFDFEYIIHNSIFHDFFENFIIFTHRLFLKKI